MTMTEHALGAVTALALRGDLVLGAAAPTLADSVRRIVDRGRRHVLLDLSQVRHIDSWGLGELVQCLTIVGQRGGGLRLVGVTRRLNDLLILTKLLTVFDCVDSLEEGLKSFVPAVAADWRPRSASAP